MALGLRENGSKIKADSVAVVVSTEVITPALIFECQRVLYLIYKPLIEEKEEGSEKRPQPVPGVSMETLTSAPGNARRSRAKILTLTISHLLKMTIRGFFTQHPL